MNPKDGGIRAFHEGSRVKYGGVLLMKITFERFLVTVVVFCSKRSLIYSVALLKMYQSSGDSTQFKKRATFRSRTPSRPIYI